MNRRRLLKAGAALWALDRFPHELFASATRKDATDRIALGPRRVSASRLAIGTGTNGAGGSSDQTRKLGIRGLADLLKFGYDNGVTFWDSADQYGSHPHLREALNSVRRENVTILTKTHASTAAQMKADLDRFRREINTDYLDIVLLHNMQEGDWPERKRGAMEAISEAQERGIVRTKGASCHTLAALKTAATEPWVEVDLARFNAAQAFMDADPETVLGVLKQMKNAGKGVIGMKILGAGQLASKVDECLQFTLAHSATMDCFTIGAESQEQLADLIRKIPAASLRA